MVLAACMIPLWAFRPTIALLAAGAVGMQFAVQGTWGVIPAHLNELSPPQVRATFTGFTYQLGNLVAAGTAQLEASLAQRTGYGEAMALVLIVVLGAVFALSALGYLVRPENRFAPLAVMSS